MDRVSKNILMTVFVGRFIREKTHGSVFVGRGGGSGCPDLGFSEFNEIK